MTAKKLAELLEAAGVKTLSQAEETDLIDAYVEVADRVTVQLVSGRHMILVTERGDGKLLFSPAPNFDALVLMIEEVFA